jgi:hypothetical protein
LVYPAAVASEDLAIQRVAAALRDARIVHRCGHRHHLGDLLVHHRLLRHQLHVI